MLKKYSEVSWSIGDMLACYGHHKFTVKQLEEFLENNENHIRDAMVDAGWIAVQECMFSFKQEIIKAGAKEHNLKYFIETGTYLGDMVDAVKDIFINSPTC